MLLTLDLSLRLWPMRETMMMEMMRKKARSGIRVSSRHMSLLGSRARRPGGRRAWSRKVRVQGVKRGRGVAVVE